MGRFAGWVLAVVMAGCGVACASGRHEDWKAVKRLGVGLAVEVRSAGQAGLEECRVVRVDDTALTCERERDPNADWDAGSGARLVFPRSAVEGVWVWQDGSDQRILAGCQGRSKTRPVGRSKSRPVVGSQVVGYSGEEGRWSVAEAALLPRGAFGGRVSVRKMGDVCGGSA
jgi:hypothetical protein